MRTMFGFSRAEIALSLFVFLLVVSAGFLPTWGERLFVWRARAGEKKGSA